MESAFLRGFWEFGSLGFWDFGGQTHDKASAFFLKNNI
jgi:hypothetical protein